MKANIFMKFFICVMLVNLAKINAQATLVKDINPGTASSSPVSFTKLGNNLIFQANNSTYGKELWISDGTDAGTTLLKDLHPGPANGIDSPLYLIDNEIYFYGYSPDAPGGGIFKTDGTTVGTVLVKSGFSSFGSFGVGKYIKINGIIYFVASSSYNNLDELWKTDGTPAGTVLVKSFRPNSYFYSYTRNLTLSPVANEFLFTSDNGTGMALWKSDGTTAGTTIVKYLYNTPQNLVRTLSKFNEEVFFGAYNSSGVESIWKTDGTTAGTTIFKSPFTLKISFPMEEINDQIYFGGFTEYAAGYGSELWTSNGTPAGTIMIKDIEPGSGEGAPFLFLKFQNDIFFSAQTSNNGRELWKTDGTEAGTELVYDFNPGSASGNPMTYTNTDVNKIYIVADNGTDVMLYESNGTQAGTNSIIDISESNLITSTEVISVNGVLFFNRQTIANGTELWKLDTTLAAPNFQTEKITLYPNPVKSNVIIDIPYVGNYSIEIINVYGQIIFSQNEIKTNQVINMEHFPSGIYLVNINSEGKTIRTQKIIKQN